MPYTHKKGRKDNAQYEIESVLDTIPGLVYHDTSALGGGLPDMIIGWRGINLLVEVKNPKREDFLTPAEVSFFAKWAGAGCPLIVATCAQDIFDWFNERIER